MPTSTGDPQEWNGSVIFAAQEQALQTNVTEGKFKEFVETENAAQ